MTPVGQVVYTVLWLYLLVLIARFVIDMVQVFARDWRPKGPVLVLAEAVYTITDPPLRVLRKVIPPLRVGGVALDLSFLVLFIVIQILMQVALRF